MLFAARTVHARRLFASRRCHPVSGDLRRLFIGSGRHCCSRRSALSSTLTLASGARAPLTSTSTPPARNSKRHSVRSQPPRAPRFPPSRLVQHPPSHSGTLAAPAPHPGRCRTNLNGCGNSGIRTERSVSVAFRSLRGPASSQAQRPVSQVLQTSRIDSYSTGVADQSNVRYLQW